MDVTTALFMPLHVLGTATERTTKSESFSYLVRCTGWDGMGCTRTNLLAYSVLSCEQAIYLK
jgi:hypothetical protein